MIVPGWILANTRTKKWLKSWKASDADSAKPEGSHTSTGYGLIHTSKGPRNDRNKTGKLKTAKPEPSFSETQG
jgi:hypothetical protein